MVVVVFRSRLKEGVGAEIEAIGQRMYEIATTMPGFVSYKDFLAGDGENLALVEFDTHEHLLAWRHHSEHREAQRQGRETLFSEYHIQVCDVVRDYAFP